MAKCAPLVETHLWCYEALGYSVVWEVCPTKFGLELRIALICRQQPLRVSVTAKVELDWLDLTQSTGSKSLETKGRCELWMI